MDETASAREACRAIGATVTMIVRATRNRRGLERLKQAATRNGKHEGEHGCETTRFHWSQDTRTHADRQCGFRASIGVSFVMRVL